VVLIEPADDALRLEIEELRVGAQERAGVDGSGEFLERGVGLERPEISFRDPGPLRGVRHREASRLPRLLDRGGDALGGHAGRADVGDVHQLDELAG